MTGSQQLLDERARRDLSLYERYGKPLEQEHRGEYVAIGTDGSTIVGQVPSEMLRDAISTFGSGHFALRRIGHRTFGQWLTFSR